MGWLWWGILSGYASEGEVAEEIPAHVVAARNKVDWSIAGDEAVRTLSAYLQVDTRNPPGDEDLGVSFLAERLDGWQIPWERLELAPGRSTLIARLKGSGAERPLCLMHHIDTVSAEADRWPEGKGPWSGAVADGFVWGRGALDMKGLGVLQLHVLGWLKKLEIPLDRDVVLLAVADEEAGNLGAKQLADPAVWERIGCSHLINEGGLGVKDALFEGQAIHAISVAEKGVLWVEVIAEGRAGHGSVPQPEEEAPERLRRAMEALEGYRPQYRIDPAMYELLANVGAQKGGLTGMVLRSKALVRTLAWGKLRGNPTTNATLHDTLHLTGMAGGEAPNVVPSRVSATYDCRLLPGTSPDAMLQRLQERVAKIPGISIRVIQSERSNGSPVDDPLYRAIAKYAVEGRPNAVAGPLLSVGFTDSIYLRPLEVAAYGYAFFEVDSETAETMHGHGERVPVDEVKEGLRRLFSVVVDQAALP